MVWSGCTPSDVGQGGPLTAADQAPATGRYQRRVDQPARCGTKVPRNAACSSMASMTTTSAWAIMKPVPSALGVVPPPRSSAKMPTTHTPLPAVISHTVAR
jgi:hypothetical protein